MKSEAASSRANALDLNSSSPLNNQKSGEFSKIPGGGKMNSSIGFDKKESRDSSTENNLIITLVNLGRATTD